MSAVREGPLLIQGRLLTASQRPCESKELCSNYMCKLVAISLILAIIGLHSGTSASQEDSLAESIDSLRCEAQFEQALELARRRHETISANHEARVFETGDAERLVRTLERICEMDKHAQRDLSEAYSLTPQIELAKSKDNSTEAIALLERQLAFRKRHLGPYDPEVADCLGELAQIYRANGNFSAGETACKEALQILEAHLEPNHPNIATILDNLAQIYAIQGRYVLAEGLFLRSLDIYEHAFGPRHEYLAIALSNVGMFYSMQARYSEAEPLYQRSLSMFREVLPVDDPELAGILNNVGLFYSEQRRYTDVEPYYLEALRIVKQAFGEDNARYAQMLNNVATLRSRQGRFSAAEPLYVSALEIRQRVLKPNNPAIATSLANLAEHYRDQRRYSEAEPLLISALAIGEKSWGKESRNQASFTRALASLYEAQGRLLAADSLYGDVLAIRKSTLRPNHPDVASSYSDMGLVAIRAGNYTAADTLLDRATAIYEQNFGPDHELVAPVLSNKAWLSTLEGRYSYADSLSSKALEIRISTLGREHPSTGRSYANLSRVRRLEGRDDALLAAFDAHDIYRRDFQRNGRFMSEPDALRYAKTLRQTTDLYLSTWLDYAKTSASKTDSAADVIVATKGLVGDGLQEIRNLLAAEEGDSVAAKLNQQIRDISFQQARIFTQRPNSDVAPYRARADSLDRKRKRLELELTQRSANYELYAKTNNATAAAVAAHIPRRAAVLEFFRFNYIPPKGDAKASPHYLVLVLDSSGRVDLVDLGNAEPIDQGIKSYRTHLAEFELEKVSEPHRNERELYHRISSFLHERLWKPIEPHLHDVDFVMVSPDGAINVVSFAGLWVAERNEYLVERYAIHYLSAARDLIRYPSSDRAGIGLLAMGAPAFGATVQARLGTSDAEKIAFRGQDRAACELLSELEWAPISGTSDEIKKIARSWSTKTNEPITEYLGVLASEERFKAEAHGSRVIHLATHGYYLQGSCSPGDDIRGGFEEVERVADNPLLMSGLALAGANLHGTGADLEGAEDGILTAYEVSAMNLRGVEMVVLSACETALGTVEEGEGVYGLRRAFLTAGARTVVSALWSVPDKVTAEMMGELYEQSDKPAYERVRQLQLRRIHLLREKHKEHPLSWGAFIVVGDPGI